MGPTPANAHPEWCGGLPRSVGSAEMARVYPPATWCGWTHAIFQNEPTSLIGAVARLRRDVLSRPAGPSEAFRFVDKSLSSIGKVVRFRLDSLSYVIRDADSFVTDQSPPTTTAIRVE